MKSSHVTSKRSAWVLLAALLATLAVLAPYMARAESAPIFLDGFFPDWTGPVDQVDPAGDGGGSGIDFRELDLANDDGFLFIRFQTTAEIGIQAAGNGLFLYLDTDMNAGTGLAIGGIGAELRWDFGGKTGCFYPSGSCVTINQNALRLRMLPSVTASTFEIAIGRDVRPNGTNLLFPGPTFRALLLDAGTGGDRVPDAGGLDYTFDATPVASPAPIPFSRADAADVRLVTWNTRDLESGSSFNPAVTPSADRVLSAIDPNIICFQEVYNATAAQTQALIAGMLPPGPWYAAKQNDCHVVSRFPILQSWPLDGNLAVLLDADIALDADLLLVSAHLPCCTNEATRQSEADRIMSFFRDAMTPGGVVDVPSGTAFMIAGDLNLVGFSQQLRTLLTGDIVNQATFGPDFAPDWDGSGLGDVVSSQTERRFAYTWRSDGSTFAPGRLDFIIYNDSVLRLRKHFSVYSPEMSAAELAATGIQAADVTTVSDHLPHVADFRSVADVTSVGALPARDLAIGPGAVLGRNEVRFVLELGFEAAVEIEVLDTSGRRVRSLLDGSVPMRVGRHALVWDGGAAWGQAAPSGVYFVRVVARAATGEPKTRSVGARWVLLR